MVVCCKAPWVFLLLIAVLMAIQQPKASFRPCRQLAGHSAVNEASRCFCTVGPPWREGQSQAETRPVLPPIRGSCGQEMRALSEAPDSRARSVTCPGLARRPVPACCVSMRPAAVVQLAVLQYKPVPRPGGGGGWGQTGFQCRTSAQKRPSLCGDTPPTTGRPPAPSSGGSGLGE